MKEIEILTQEAIELLKSLIETPSFSSEENQTALLIENWFIQNNIIYNRETIMFGLLINFLMKKPTLYSIRITIL